MEAALRARNVEAALRARKEGHGADQLLSGVVRLFSVAACAALPLVMAFCLVATVVRLLAEDKVSGDSIKILCYFAAIAFLAAPGAIWLVAKSKRASWHLRLAVIYALLNWALRLVAWLTAIWENRRFWWGFVEGRAHVAWDEKYGSQPMVKNAIDSVQACILLAMILIGARLAILRLRALERACLVKFHATQVHCLFGIACVLVVPMVLSLLMASQLLGQISALVLVCVALVAVSAFLHGIWSAMRLAAAAWRKAPEGRKLQAKSVCLALRIELLCTMLMGASSCALALLWSSYNGFLLPQIRAPADVLHAVEMLDMLCNQWFALNLSGALSGAMRGTAARAAATKDRRRRWRSAQAEWYSRRKEEKSDDRDLWDDKVLELAGRGISLRALLHFYRELPEVMPYYDPRRHTTNDVVRGAIIPFSATQKSSCASVLMGDKFTLPSKMVTHNWSNLFLDLMAAILADALAESEFSMISSLLKSDLERLEKWVEHANVGSRTYWVCAFSVNQHVGICGSVRTSAKDTVTGERPQKCTCDRKKAWNDTEPLLQDGRSIPCEMNKFDDMMKFLAAVNPAFEQVVAVDSRFSLFSRAWCVAELATASWTGMVQSLKIYSQEAMSEHVERLRGLQIQDMEASREEDKQAILASISDLDAFNADLQKLLFQDLFPAWTSLDAEERMASAGSVIRWLPVWAATAELDTGDDNLLRT